VTASSLISPGTFAQDSSGETPLHANSAGIGAPLAQVAENVGCGSPLGAFGALIAVGATVVAVVTMLWFWSGLGARNERPSREQAARTTTSALAENRAMRFTKRAR
jgi:hypothetical protein